MRSLPSGGSRERWKKRKSWRKKSRLGVLTIVCVSALPWCLLYNHQECHKSSAFISHLFHLLDPHPLEPTDILELCFQVQDIQRSLLPSFLTMGMGTRDNCPLLWSVLCSHRWLVTVPTKQGLLSTSTAPCRSILKYPCTVGNNTHPRWQRIQEYEPAFRVIKPGIISG